MNDCHVGYGKIKFNEYMAKKFQKRKTNKGYIYDRIKVKADKDHKLF
jgi:hypothetical protein